MMLRDFDERDIVLAALNAGQYEVGYEPVNNIFRCKRYDGSHFYVYEDLDDFHSEVDLGQITFEVEGSESHRFIYDLETGEWWSDPYTYRKDADVIAALESLPEFIPFDAYSLDRKWEVYCLENDIEEGTVCYRSGDAHCPKDVEEFGDLDLRVPLRYFMGTVPGAPEEGICLEAEMTDEDLYAIYRKLGMKERLERGDVVVTDEELLAVLPELYQEVLDQVLEAVKTDDEVSFVLLLTKKVFDAFL